MTLTEQQNFAAQPQQMQQQATQSFDSFFENDKIGDDRPSFYNPQIQNSPRVG